MRNVPEWIPARAFRRHVSGVEPQGERPQIPHPDPEEWKDPGQGQGQGQGRGEDDG